MTTTVSAAFAKLYAAEVKESYQRKGSKLRNAVRVQTVTDAADVTWQKVGTAVATTKSRNSLIAVSDVTHTSIVATLVDYYSGQWLDALDELKLNIPERQVLTNAGAYSLGRKSDELILTQLAGLAASTTVSVASKASFLNSILTAIESLNVHDVPDDGDRWAVVSPRFWSWLMLLSEFSNSDYVGQDELPFRLGRFMQVKHWLGVHWLQHSGVSGVGATSSNLLFHKTAVGHAIGQEATADISWHGDRQAHFIAHSISQAATLIDSAGGIKLSLDETAALATS
jgi:hypothetical protein